MIRRHRNSVILFLCFQAMAVAIICLGSLINFHQYKIWGKPLIPNFVGYKRDVEKYSKTLSFSKFSGNQHVQKGNPGNDLDFPFELLHIQYGNISPVLQDLSQKVPVSVRVSCFGLRGPPVS